MGTPLGPKYIPFTYMDPLGYSTGTLKRFVSTIAEAVLRNGPAFREYCHCF